MRESRLFAALVLLPLIILGLSCVAPSDDDEEIWYEVDLVVDHDDIYGFQPGDVIGSVKYSELSGSIGAMIAGVCRIDQLSRFSELDVEAKFFVANPDVLRSGYNSQEWLQSGNEYQFNFYVPQVETIPSVVDFRVMIYENLNNTTDDDDDNNDDDNDDDNNDNDTTVMTATPEETAGFYAWATMPFTVTEGSPATGD